MKLREAQQPQRYIELAVRSLRSAKLLLDADDREGAANRAFYAMFHAATAALAVRGEWVGTHAGLIGRFSDLFIKQGDFPKELGRAFNLAEDRRLEADYLGVTMPQDAIVAMIADAEHFVVEVAARLMPQPPG